MKPTNKDRFDGHSVTVFQDEDGDYVAHLTALPHISSFGPTPEKALHELAVAWELAKEKQ